MAEENIQIHETAFVTSTFRAFDENLSRDTFAKLWHNPTTDKWIEEYLARVSSEEPYTHCLRNRYFLEKMKDLFASGEIEVLINFGSGFSMYPFLLDKGLLHIEIDKPEIIGYKEGRIKAWQESGLLPERRVHFLGVDFSEDYQEELLAEIRSIVNDRPSFILVEGVLFFLDREETDKLFDFFNVVQKKGDYIGSASFQEGIKETAAFRNLIRFFGQKVSKTSESDYQSIEDAYYQTRENYTLMEHQDYFTLSKKYGNSIKQPADLILNENFYLLRKDSL